MSYIEFIGPSGAGKTTLHTTLVESDGRYYGVPDVACSRMLLDKAPPKYRWVYRVLPGPVRSRIKDMFLSCRCRRAALTQFLKSHTDAFHASMAAVGASNGDMNDSTKYAKWVIEQYAMGTMTVHEDERLCLDESFAMLGYCTQTRLPSEEYPLETFFQHTPTPAVLIHVDAPSDVCLERQRDRNRVAAQPRKEGETVLEAQERARKVAKRVADIQSDRTTVISVTNTGSIDEVVDRIKTELESTLGSSLFAGSPSKQRNSSTPDQTRM